MFFKKKKLYYNKQSSRKVEKIYDLTYDNVAIPEVHTHEETIRYEVCFFGLLG